MNNVTATPGSSGAQLQQAIDSIAASGGGDLIIPRGVYPLKNALRLRSGVNIVGEEGASLRRLPGPESRIPDYLGYGHYEFTVDDPDLFEVGMGVHIADDDSRGFYQTVATITDRKDDLLFIDRMLNHDYSPSRNAVVTNVFSIIEGVNVSDVCVSGLILDGNPETPHRANNCRAGGVYLLLCNRITIDGVEVKDFKGEGIGFQQCTDLFIRNCFVHDNSGGGIHPGSGSVRYIIEKNRVQRNGGCGIFYCLRTTHSICRENHVEGNGIAGISIGERDSDHEINGNTVTGNVGYGIEFRKPVRRGGDRVIIEGNALQNNGEDYEIMIPSDLKDIYIQGNSIDPGEGKAVFVGPDCRRIGFSGNAVSGRDQTDGDIQLHTDSAIADDNTPLPSVGPQALPLDGAKHLNIEQLPKWRAGT